MKNRMIGELAGWTLQPGYPKLSGKYDSQQIEAQYAGPISSLAGIPRFGSTFSDPDFPYFSTFADLKLTDSNVEMMAGAMTAVVTLIYTIPEDEDLGGGGDDDKNKPKKEWSYVSREIDVPIEQHQKYKKLWTHNFCVEKTFDPTGSNVCYTTTEGVFMPCGKDCNKCPWVEENPDKAKFIKFGETMPTGWIVKARAVKPGVTSFKSYVPEVHYKESSAKRDRLMAVAEKDGTIVTPSETFGRSGEWLQSGSQIQKEGKLWVLTVAYLNSKEIDKDLYGSDTPPKKS